MENGDSSMELIKTDHIREKFEQLDVESELQVSVLADLIKLRGAAAYLKEERKSARASSMSLLYKLETEEECIDIRDIRKNKDKINAQILSASDDQSIDATHVVVGIDWGAVCLITCEYENNENEEDSKVQTGISDQLEKLKDAIESKASEDACNNSLNNDQRFSFRCCTDVTPLDKGLPVTFEGAVDMARNLTSLVDATNKGRGVPLRYTLMPMDAVVKTCKLNVKIQKQYTVIDEDIVKKCAHIVADEVTKTRLTLYSVYNDLNTYVNFINEDALQKIDDVLQKFREEESTFRDKLQGLVREVRLDNEDISILEKFLGEDLSNTIDVSWYKDQIRGFQKDIHKITIVRSWESKGIRYIGTDDEVIVDDKKKVYVLYKLGEKDAKNEVDKNQELFLRLQISYGQDRESYKFIVVDQDVRNDLWSVGETKSTIHVFEDGYQTSADLYAEMGKDTEMCLITITDPTPQQRRPVKRAHVKLRCPNALSGNGQCSGNPLTWMCSQCKEVVEYGTETKLFHCKCGKSDPKQALFRCNEKDHGMHYLKYPDEILETDLSTHKAVKEKNILILGETGVGKSTWINGFINYLYFADMEEAINADEFHVLIPSSFTFTQQGKEKKIMVGGTDSNENMETGKSATKEPRSYVFYVGGEVVRLIDTPGVGDSGGITHDKKNFDNILSYLTYYEDIHAVCILLKPNNARLTVMFRFCIQELLAHLHTSAKDNIVFCFTNARATFYQPGDTLPALNKELTDRNVGIEATPDNYFCFDNEPFRFLACVKSGVEFSKGEINTYAESWNKSVEETRRLFEYIGSLKPHKIRNTLSMNEARRIIVAMSKPLAEVAKTIQHNVQEGNEAKTQIDLAVKDMTEMKTKLTFSGYGVKRTELNYPMTVCADPRCVQHIQVGKTRVQNTVYKQICHDGCSITGVPTETTNDQRLQNCWAMSPSRTYCQFCGHHYTVHMHITYSTEIFKEDFLSQDVQDQINQKNSIKAQKEAFKQAVDAKNDELMKEEKIIMKTSAKYGSFLKANAIIAYNDAVGDYLDMCIEQERNKPQAIRNDTLLTTLEDMKRQYVKERKILDEAIDTDTGENIHSPEEVMKLQRELFDLKHMGKTLKDLFDGISISHSARNISFQEKTAPIRQNRKRRRNRGTANPILSLLRHFLPSDYSQPSNHPHAYATHAGRERNTYDSAPRHSDFTTY